MATVCDYCRLECELMCDECGGDICPTHSRDCAKCGGSYCPECHKKHDNSVWDGKRWNTETCGTARPVPGERTEEP